MLQKMWLLQRYEDFYEVFWEINILHTSVCNNKSVFITNSGIENKECRNRISTKNVDRDIEYFDINYND